MKQTLADKINGTHPAQPVEDVRGLYLRIGKLFGSSGYDIQCLVADHLSPEDREAFRALRRSHFEAQMDFLDRRLVKAKKARA